MKINAILTMLFGFLTIGSPVIFADDLPDGVVNSQNPNDISLSPAESLKRITVPDGFEVTLFAGEPDIRRPIAFDFDDRGRLWVVENYSHPKFDPDNKTDRIVILEDTNHDGRFDQRKVFWDQGRYVTAIAVGYGGVWIGNTPELMFIPDRDYDDVPDAKPTVVLDGFAVSSNNVVNNFHWGPDGWLYGAIGLNPTSLIGKPGTPAGNRVKISRGMWRMHPVTHQFERIADGMVNPWGADFNAVGDLFTVNTVIAHLWHIVPGMYCQRRANEGDYPYVYRRIQSHADHLHWGGGTWQSSRQTTETHSVAGGGHAHCGAMVYLGDNWPEEYRGKLFTLNLHGARINQEVLTPHDSTYVAKHDQDLFMANDDWFRGLSLKYGPDGGVYITDWHDFGECHDNDGSHRTSGRIYKMTWGTPSAVSMDLQKLNQQELVSLLSHKNEWFVRHARRILHERTAFGVDQSQAESLIKSRLKGGRLTETQILRFLWALYGMDALSTEDLVQWTHHRSEHVRRWAIKLIFDQGEPQNFGELVLEGAFRLGIQGRIVEMAYGDPSPKVLLAIASSMQQVQPANRWMLAETLTRQRALLDDETLTLMTWYAIEPLIHEDRHRFINLALDSPNPVLQQFIMRRACEGNEPELEDVIAAIHSFEGKRLAMLSGVLKALNGNAQTEPKAWKPFYREMSKSEDSQIKSHLVRLAGVFGDESALVSLRNLVGDPLASLEERQDAMQALAEIPGGLTTDLLHATMLADNHLRGEAIRQLVTMADEKTSVLLLDIFDKLDRDQQTDAVTVMVTQRSSALELLQAVQSGKVTKESVNAFALEQLRAFGDSEIESLLSGLWASDSTKLQKAEEISRLRALMTREHLGKGDASEGRLLFYKTCFKCHQLYGEGGRVGPDLTGSGRKQVDYLLSNLLDPSAEIDADYKLTTVISNAGRLYSGFVIHQDDRVVRLRTQNADVQLQMKDVDEIIPTKKSMMPEGMLRELSDDQIRDLFLYLTGSRQVPLPTANDR